VAKAKTSVVKRLTQKGLISPPPFVPGSVQYETMMGSVAYGVSSDTSDCDVYGFCMPPKDVVFPHLSGYVHGFSTQVPSFDQYQQHHILEKDTRKEWDLQIYSIIKYFRLCMDCNPNMIDSLFTESNMVMTRTKIAQMVRDKRKVFLSKKAWHRFRGYAHSQLAKLKVKDPDPSSRRYDMVKQYGYDVKFAYHVVRLIDEVEQILEHQDIDLMRDRERLKAIRRGEWKLEDLQEWFTKKEKSMISLYEGSKLPDRPREQEIRQLLLDCLEEYYGDLSSAVVTPDQATQALRQIAEIVRKVK
jgi:predicted nucleotidyltransferase